MRTRACPSYLVVLVAALAGANAHAAQRGVVQAVAVTPASAAVGTTITVTITGVNPCGAVLVDWGDGTAVTHPIVQLPETRAHAYTTGGRYTIQVRGQGNCDGQAVAAVRIDGPPARADRRQLTGFTVSSAAVRGVPVRMEVEGRGDCRVSVEYGDGNTQELSVQLPHTFTHVYAEARAYNVTASALAPCEGGRHTARLEVADAPSPAAAAAAPRISSLTLRRNPAAAAATVTIRVAGTGECTYALDYGDGNSERRSAALPDRVQHVYPSAGTFVVVATAQAPCEGTVQETLVLGRAEGSLDRLVVFPDPARMRSNVTLTIEGRGTCRVTVDLDDGNEQTVEGRLPVRIVHRYARAGRYDVFAWAAAPCSGDAGVVIRVER